MQFPLSVDDISFVFAVMAIVLLSTYELITQYFGRPSLAIEKKVLKNASIMFGFAFMFRIIFLIYQIISVA